MSRVQNTPPLWPSISNESTNSKYEKCRNITEEIYKRINITFQIKSLEAGSQSELSCDSDQIEIDSNELSNGTDLFAYEKSDSISSSSELDTKKSDKLINLNNNEIKKSVVPIYKPPRKRFRKKVKKRISRGKPASEGSSDEAPLSRMAEPPGGAGGGGGGAGGGGGGSGGAGGPSPDRVMGVPNVTISVALAHKQIDRETKYKMRQPDKHSQPPSTVTHDNPTVDFSLKACTVAITDQLPSTVGSKTTRPGTVAAKSAKPDDGTGEWKKCSLCNLPCRGERGLRRHMSLSHILMPEEMVRPKTRKSTEGKAD